MILLYVSLPYYIQTIQLNFYEFFQYFFLRNLEKNIAHSCRMANNNYMAFCGEHTSVQALITRNSHRKTIMVKRQKHVHIRYQKLKSHFNLQ